MAIHIISVLFPLKSILRSHFNRSNRIRNDQVMAKIQKTGRNWEQRSRCTGTPLKCTGTLWPKMTRNESVPVHFQSVLVQVTRNALKCVFSHIFFILLIDNQFYTSNTHQNHSKFTLESLFYSIPLSITYISSKIFHEFLQGSFQYGL